MKIKDVFLVCDTHGRHVINPQDNFQLVSCLDCEAVFIPDLTINEEYYSKNYSNDYYEVESSIKPVSRLEHLLNKLSVKIKESLILKNFLRGDTKLKILDVGCGDGKFLENLDVRFFEKYGLEINPKGYGICKDKGLKVANKELKNASFEDSFFDVVTLWHVIEHLKDPNETLGLIKKILKKEGVLMIATPDTDSLGFKFGKKYWFHLDVPRHLILYNKKSLSLLLEKAGFKVINDKNLSFDFPFDLFWSMRKSWLKYLVYPLYPFFKFFDRETMLLIVKKKD